MELAKYLLENVENSPDITRHIVKSLSVDDLERLEVEQKQHYSNDSRVRFLVDCIDKQRFPTWYCPDIPKAINAPIQALLDDFSNVKSGCIVNARRELQKRFEYQSFDDQKRIINAFMEKGTKSDVVWCSKHFVELFADILYIKGESHTIVDCLLWKEAYLDAVKSYWEKDMENYKLLKVIVKFASLDYLREKIQGMESESEGIIDSVAYTSLVLRMCEEEGYVIPKEKLTPFKYAYICAKSNRQLTEEEADLALRQVSLEKSNLGLALWSVAKTGNTQALIRFNEEVLKPRSKCRHGNMA